MEMTLNREGRERHIFSRPDLALARACSFIDLSFSGFPDRPTRSRVRSDETVSFDSAEAGKSTSRRAKEGTGIGEERYLDRLLHSRPLEKSLWLVY